MRPIRAFAQGQQIVIPEGAASFAFEDRDYSATEKEEIVSALYSLSGTVPETGTGNVIATRDENNQQVNKFKIYFLVRSNLHLRSVRNSSSDSVHFVSRGIYVNWLYQWVFL